MYVELREGSLGITSMTCKLLNIFQLGQDSWSLRKVASKAHVPGFMPKYRAVRFLNDRLREGLQDI